MKTKENSLATDITLGILILIAAIIYGLLMKHYGGY